MPHGSFKSALRPRPVAALLAAGLILGAAACDDEPDRPAMVMQSQPAPAPGPRTTPAEEMSLEEAVAVPVYISIDGEPHEFPPAKLYIKRYGERVRAQLMSDDPPEAIRRGWSGDSFYFEMDMEVPDGVSGDGTVSAEDLAAAEWVFRNESTERIDSPSGIFLGGKFHLQPVHVSVMFDPLDETTVIVNLNGVFSEFDKNQPRERLPRRQVRVQAVLPADAIRR